MSKPGTTGIETVTESKRTAKEAALKRACDYCRGLKVKCFPDPASSTGSCQRCARSDRTCTFAAPQRRKQRKRTDARVAELEKEMKALRSLLRLDDGGNNMTDEIHGTEQTVKDSRHGSYAAPDQKISPRALVDHNLNLTPDSQMSIRGHSSQVPDTGDLDVVDRGLLSMATATALYNVYINELVPHYPAVTFPDRYTAEELRRQRPTLFLAVIAAAAGKTDPELYGLLNTEVLQVYATRTVISGEKSLELVQSMLITTVWYYPSGPFNKLRFYQFIHMAATIALDIGLGSKPSTDQTDCQLPQIPTTINNGTTKNHDVQRRFAEEELDITAIDRRRTILVCYIVCSGVAISMRRPNMLRFNSWMNDCVLFLEDFPNVTMFDKRLVARVRLMNIAEEFASSLSLDDPDNKSIVLDSRTLRTMQAFERRLKSWKDSLDLDVMNVSMLMSYCQINILLHEIALRVDHPAEDFKPPFMVKSMRPVRSEMMGKEKLAALAIDAVMSVVTYSHALLDAFLSSDVNTLRALPVCKFAIVSYAVLVLTKLNQSIDDPQSELGKLLDRNSVAIDSYSESVRAHLANAAGSEEFRVPSIFCGIISCFQLSHRRRISNSSPENEEETATRPSLYFGSQKTGDLDVHSLQFPPPGARDTSASTNPSASRDSTSNGFNPPSAHLPPFTQNNDTNQDNSGYPEQFASEEWTGHSLSRPVHESGLNDQLDIDYSLFPELAETSAFTKVLDNWVSSAGVTGGDIDEQMPDLHSWEQLLEGGL